MFPKCSCGAPEKMYYDNNQPLQFDDRNDELWLLEVEFICRVCGKRQLFSFRCTEVIDAIE